LHTQSVNNTPTPQRATINVNARAAELKLRLLKGKELRGATPHSSAGIPGLVSRQNPLTDASNSLRSSPKTPVTSAESHEQDLNALISQYSTEPKPAANPNIKQENNSESNLPVLQGLPSGLATPAMSQDLSLGSPTIATNPSSNGIAGVSGHDREASISDMSEGEILDEPEPESKRVIPPTAQDPIKSGPAEDKESSKSPEESQRPPQDRAPKADAIAHRAAPTNPKSHKQRNRDDGREYYEARQERRATQDYRHERRPYAEPDHRASRRDSRDEERRRQEPKLEPRREEQPREQKPPTLEALLPHDEDLREWLEITGYHNAPYRDKILSRRRAIAALDAQRMKLVAEMEAEERGGIAAVPGSSMLPPTLPNKTGSRIEPNATQDAQNDRLSSNKRRFSDVQDSPADGSIGKLARTDSNSQRLKEEEESEYRQQQSNGFSSSRRSSFDRRDERDGQRGRYEDDRADVFRARTRVGSREQSVSPGRQVYESRPPARTRSYESQDFRDSDEPERTSRPFEVHGSYRGRAYDPNYRGRGRGRRRGDFQSHYDSRNEAPFGFKISGSKPFKDSRGFSRGGKGGQ
jgi:YTH domain-containing protein 1